MTMGHVLLHRMVVVVPASMKKIVHILRVHRRRCLSREFQNFFNSNDVILITESWTDEYSDIEVSNFDSSVLQRKEKKKGCKKTLAELFCIFEVNMSLEIL